MILCWSNAGAEIYKEEHACVVTDKETIFKKGHFTSSRFLSTYSLCF